MLSRNIRSYIPAGTILFYYFLGGIFTGDPGVMGGKFYTGRDQSLPLSQLVPYCDYDGFERLSSDFLPEGFSKVEGGGRQFLIHRSVVDGFVIVGVTEYIGKEIVSAEFSLQIIEDGSHAMLGPQFHGDENAFIGVTEEGYTFIAFSTVAPLSCAEQFDPSDRFAGSIRS